MTNLGDALEAAYTTQPTESVGSGLVRIARRDEDMSGLLVADFCYGLNPKYLGDAQLFIAAKDLLEVALMVLDTATIETNPALIAAAEAAINKALASNVKSEPTERLLAKVGSTDGLGIGGGEA